MNNSPQVFSKLLCMIYQLRPDIELFKRFKVQWQNINLSQFVPGVDDTEVSKVISFKNRKAIVSFVENQLNIINKDRKDYKELLQLTLLYLGVKNDSNIHFKKPGAMHRARWMAKLIYSLKIYLLRDQVVLSGTKLF